MAAYSIVHFEHTQEVEVVPIIWLDGPDRTFWPPFKSADRLKSAILKRLPPDTETWTQYQSRIIANFPCYEDARKRLKKAEDTSDLATDLEETTRPSRRRIRPNRLSSSESDHEEVIIRPKPPTKKAKAIPTPPQMPNFVMEDLGKSPLRPSSASTKSSTNSLPPCGSPTQLVASPGTSRSNAYASDIGVNTSEQEFRRQVLRQLHFIKATILQHGEALDALLKRNDRQIEDDAPVPDEHNFPLATQQDLNHLEETLLDNSKRKRVVASLSSCGGVNPIDSTKRILKRLLTNELASQYSWFGAKGKHSFSALKLSSVILEAVQLNRNTRDATLKDVEDVGKTWLKHAKDRLPKAGPNLPHRNEN